MDGCKPWPRHFIACLIIDFQNDLGQVTVHLSYLVGFFFFFICASEALLVSQLCLLGMEQGNTRNRAIFRGKATPTFENNSVAGEKNNPAYSSMFVTRVSWTFLRWLIIIAVVYYRICVCREITIRISVASDNVPSWVLTWYRPLPGKANKILS